MSWFTRKNQKGFTLIELLLALAILGVVTYFIVSLTSSVRQGGKVGETKQRMEIISAKMKEYYRAQGNLPEYPEDSGGATLTNEVPVDRLNLEAKFRFDGFGQPIFYHYFNDGTNYDPEVINEVEVDGVGNMAGYLLSLGGDQEVDATLDNDDNTAESAGDDILMAINVNREAMEIALDEVRELQRRVNQFDNLFTGSDACARAENIANLDTCPPNNDPDFPDANDPNCGTASLDQIEDDEGVVYDCDNTALSGRTSGYISDARTFIIAYYGLGDNFEEDPWGNPYQWGCSSNTDGGICTSAPRFTTADKQYRKFFSYGPNGCTWHENVTTPTNTAYCADGTTGASDGDQDDDIIP